MLMYTHVVHTSMSILNCPILPGRSGDYVPVSHDCALDLMQSLIYRYCCSDSKQDLVFSAFFTVHRTLKELLLVLQDICHCTSYASKIRVDDICKNTPTISYKPVYTCFSYTFSPYANTTTPCIALVHQWQYQLLHWRPCSSWAPCYHCTDLLSVHHSHHPHLLNGVAAGGLTDINLRIINTHSLHPICHDFIQNPGWLRHTAEVVQKGFKKQYRWWATVELGRRVLLLLVIVPFPGKDVSDYLSLHVTYSFNSHHYQLCVYWLGSVSTTIL